jgi:hypothetical protein
VIEFQKTADVFADLDRTGETANPVGCRQEYLIRGALNAERLFLKPYLFCTTPSSEDLINVAVNDVTQNADIGFVPNMVGLEARHLDPSTSRI